MLRRGQKPEGSGRFVCQSSCKKREKAPRQPQPTGRRPESRYPGRRKEQMRSDPANQDPRCGQLVGGPRGVGASLGWGLDGEPGYRVLAQEPPGALPHCYCAGEPYRECSLPWCKAGRRAIRQGCGCEQAQGLGLHCRGRNFVLSHLCLNRRARQSRTQTTSVYAVGCPAMYLSPHDRVCRYFAAPLPGPTQPYLNSQK